MNESTARIVRLHLHIARDLFFRFLELTVADLGKPYQSQQAAMEDPTKPPPPLQLPQGVLPAAARRASHHLQTAAFTTLSVFAT